MADEITPRCGTCHFWRQGAPSLATAVILPAGGAQPHLGTCELFPPAVLINAGRPCTYWPETAADRSCGEWEQAIGDDGDDGERAPTDDDDRKIVSIMGRAA